MEWAWIVKGLTGLLLLINAWQDYKEREILPWSLGAFGILGIMARMICGKAFRETMLSVLGGLGVGAAMMVVSWVSRAAVGMGDGLLLCMTGVYLGFAENLELLLGALFLCGIYSAVLLIRRKAKRKTGVPFVPFLFVSFLCGVIL